MSSKLHCASCGRPDKHGPDSANPILYEGQQWCSWCARIFKTSAGAIFVVQPSPGIMVGSSEIMIIITCRITVAEKAETVILNR